MKAVFDEFQVEMSQTKFLIGFIKEHDFFATVNRNIV